MQAQQSGRADDHRGVVRDGADADLQAPGVQVGGRHAQSVQQWLTPGIQKLFQILNSCKHV